MTEPRHDLDRLSLALFGKPYLGDEEPPQEGCFYLVRAEFVALAVEEVERRRLKLRQTRSRLRRMRDSRNAHRTAKWNVYICAILARDWLDKKCYSHREPKPGNKERRAKALGFLGRAESYFRGSGLPELEIREKEAGQ